MGWWGGGGALASVQGMTLVGGSGGILPPPKLIFKFGGSKMLFSALVMRCLQKIDLEYENSKKLQVTITKITESKGNNSIQRLDVSGLTGQGRAPAPPCSPASYGSDLHFNQL